MQNDKLIDLIAQLAKSNPQLIEGLEKGAAGGLQADKIALYNLLIKENKTFTYEAVNKVLSRHENSRLDINWNVGDEIFRIVISKRKREPVKERKPRTKKGGETNNGNQQPVEGESNSDQ